MKQDEDEDEVKKQEVVEGVEVEVEVEGGCGISQGKYPHFYSRFHSRFPSRHRRGNSNHRMPPAETMTCRNEQRMSTDLASHKPM